MLGVGWHRADPDVLPGRHPGGHPAGEPRRRPVHRRRCSARAAGRAHPPRRPAHLFGYLLCFAAVVAGAVRLADAEAESVRGNRGRTRSRSDPEVTRDEARLAGQAADEVAAMFDGVARRYDLTNTVLSLGQDRRWRDAPGSASSCTRASGCSTSPPAPASRPPSWPAPAPTPSPATSRSACCGPGGADRRRRAVAVRRRRRDAPAVRRRRVRRGRRSRFGLRNVADVAGGAARDWPGSCARVAGWWSASSAGRRWRRSGSST